MSKKNKKNEIKVEEPVLDEDGNPIETPEDEIPADGAEETVKKSKFTKKQKLAIGGAIGAAILSLLGGIAIGRVTAPGCDGEEITPENAEEVDEYGNPIDPDSEDQVQDF